MKKTLAVIAVAACFTACILSNSNDHKTENTEAKATDKDWTILFDGKTLNGWHGYGKGNIDGRWKIYDSTLILDSTVKLSGVNGNLISDELYENFDLTLDWKISEGGNSGILFYVQEDTALYHEPYNTGPEMQVLDNEKHLDGKIFKHQAGDLYDLIPSGIKSAKPVGEWNHAEIISDHGKLQLFLNGNNVVTTTMWDDKWKQMLDSSKFKSMPGFGTFKKGAICLQDHGDVVSYKNIMIKKL